MTLYSIPNTHTQFIHGPIKTMKSISWLAGLLFFCPTTAAFLNGGNSIVNSRKPNDGRRSSYVPVNHSNAKHVPMIPPKKTPAILSKQQAYFLLLCSIALECTGASLSKRSRDIGSLALFGFACTLNMTSMFGLNVVLSRIAVGTAYAAWGAIGTILVTAAGVLVFQEPWSLLKGVYLTMIATGVIGLNLSHS